MRPHVPDLSTRSPLVVLAGRVVTVCVTVCVTACGSAPGGGGPQTPTGPVTAMVTPEGGVLEVVSDALATFRVEVPAGAVLAPLELTLTPLAAEDGALLRVAVTPAGSQLLRPATITASVPDDDTAPTGTILAYTRGGTTTMLPTQRSSSGRAFTHETRLLGYAEPASASLTAQQAEEGWFDLRSAECLIAIESLAVRVEYARNFPFTSSQSAHDLIQQLESTAQLCEGDATYLDRFEAEVQALKQTSCDRYRDVAADAAVLLSEDAQTLLDLVKPMVNWEGVKQVLGTDCAGRGGPLAENLGTEFGEFVTAYSGRVDSSDFPSSYGSLWAELRSVMEISASAALLDLTQAEADVNDELLGRILDELRAAAYTSCRDDHTQVYLADMLRGGNLLGNPLVPGYVSLPPWATFSAAEVMDDVQYCASDVALEVHTEEARPRADLRRQLQGGAAPGTQTTRADTSSGVTSTLRLQGELWAFNCAAADQAPRFEPDQIVVKLAGEEVTRWQPTNGTFFAAPEVIEVQGVLADVGEDPLVRGTYPLELWRLSSACGGQFGETDAKLFTFDVDFDPVPVLNDASAGPTQIPAGEATVVTITLPFRDPGKNLVRLEGRYALGEVSESLSADLSQPTVTTGFDAEAGEGTYAAKVTVHCTEEGNALLAFAFRLRDAFDQRSEERNATVSVDYGACDA